MKYAPMLRCLALALMAATTAAQDDCWSEADQARFADTMTVMMRGHVDEPVPPGWTVHDDILVPPQAPGAEATFVTNLWPGGVVPFEFDTNMDLDDAVAAFIAMLDWEEVSGVDFVPWTEGTDAWIHIRKSDGDATPTCNSPVGKVVTSGYQLINITTSCLSDFRIHHELGHALGFYHEQSRPDRDTYVTINWDNIDDGPTCTGGSHACNFEIESSAWTYGNYDFDSVMHYGPTTFSDGTGNTIDCKPEYAQWQSVIGQKDHLSYWDTIVMGCLYPRADWRFDLPGGFPWSFGTFFLPWNKTFDDAVDDTPSGGRLVFLAGDTFDWSGTISKEITIEAPTGKLVVN